MRKADWTPQLIHVLEAEYPNRPTRELVDILGISLGSINAQAIGGTKGTESFFQQKQLQ